MTHLWDLSGDPFLAIARTTKVLTISGWLFRDRSGLRRHAGEIRQFFVPVEPYRSRAASIACYAKNSADILIGVHIRRGDYRTYLKGRFFFEFEEYAAIMKNILLLFDKKKISFLICSNEPIPTAPFNGLDFSLGSGHLIEDLYSLSKCDLLIGPLNSTFSGWASYYGSVPWYPIEDPQAHPQLSSFGSIHDVWASQ
jgi:hypothetical protein